MTIETDENGRALSLPLTDEGAGYVRMRQADIARLFEVSPARVSQWVRDGKITTYADGLICPAKAARELVKNSDVNRLRAKPFRPLRKEVEELRKRAGEVRARAEAVATEKAQIEERHRLALLMLGEQSSWLETFADAVAGIDLAERAEADEDEWQAITDQAFERAGESVLALDDAAKVAAAERLLDDLGEPHGDTANESTAAPGCRPGQPEGGAENLNEGD